MSINLGRTHLLRDFYFAVLIISRFFLSTKSLFPLSLSLSSIIIWGDAALPLIKFEYENLSEGERDEQESGQFAEW